MGRRKNPDALYYREMARAERGVLEWAVHAAGSITKAAEMLGIDRKHMHDRAKACGADLEAAKVAGKLAARAAKKATAETGVDDA